MRLKRGSKVEVMNKNEIPTSWRVARVLSGIGHTYALRYEGHPGVEKVSRKLIRPCPPRAANGLWSWVGGDIVEVFDDNSWKTATVSAVLGGGHFTMRLHGLTHEVKVHTSNIRARQSWQDGQWIPIGKISGSYGDVKAGKTVEPNRRPKSGFDAPLAGDDDAGLSESRVVSSKTPKRASPFCSSLLQRKPKKLKEDPPETENTPPPFINNTVNGVFGCSLARTPEPNDSDSDDQCSVGSCSVSSDGPNVVANARQETCALSSDAESFDASHGDEAAAENLHRLELHAYRSTLEALYASGPLSWEKEALLTNLRISLHISNDQHLAELRQLISSGGGVLD